MTGSMSKPVILNVPMLRGAILGAGVKSRPTTVDRRGRKSNSMSYLKRYKKRDQKCQEAVVKFNEEFNEAISIR